MNAKPNFLNHAETYLGVALVVLGVALCVDSKLNGA
jgi:hypothetical protein